MFESDGGDVHFMTYCTSFWKTIIVFLTPVGSEPIWGGFRGRDNLPGEIPMFSSNSSFFWALDFVEEETRREWERSLTVVRFAITEKFFVLFLWLTVVSIITTFYQLCHRRDVLWIVFDIRTMHKSRFASIGALRRGKNLIAMYSYGKIPNLNQFFRKSTVSILFVFVSKERVELWFLIHQQNISTFKLIGVL